MPEPWQLLDSTGAEISRTPSGFPVDSAARAIIWGLTARDAAGLTTAVLVNKRLGYRSTLDAPGPHVLTDLATATPPKGGWVGPGDVDVTDGWARV